MNTPARQFLPFTTRDSWLAERAKDVTSTDIAALFNVSPYCTRYELWHRKVAGDVEPAELDAERIRWGNRLQGAIAVGAAEERGWTVRPMTEYIRLMDCRIGSSFDFMVVGTDALPAAILECKNVDSLAFRDGWEETEFGLEAPHHIELQVQHQMLVSGIHQTYIAALVGGNRLVILERAYDPLVGDAILIECDKFWRDGEPSPDFHRDAELIARLNATAQAGKVIDADDRATRLITDYYEHRRMARIHNDEADARKAELLTIIGDASKVLAGEFTLSCGERAPVEVAAHTRQGYRGFIVTKRKPK